MEANRKVFGLSAIVRTKNQPLSAKRSLLNEPSDPISVEALCLNPVLHDFKRGNGIIEW